MLVRYGGIPFRPKAKMNRLVEVRRKTLQAYDKAIVSLAAVVKIDAGGRGSREHRRGAWA